MTRRGERTEGTREREEKEEKGGEKTDGLKRRQIKAGINQLWRGKPGGSGRS